MSQIKIMQKREDMQEHEISLTKKPSLADLIYWLEFVSDQDIKDMLKVRKYRMKANRLQFGEGCYD